MYLKKLIKKEKLTYQNIIWFAVVCGVLTGLILDVELYKIPSIANNSLFNIGICFEFWIFATMIIITRTNRPLEAACKVFVFFLISQPLVYLVKVPVDPRGWGVFVDYTGWFIWTLLTFPGALIAWYTNKKNNLSIAIFMVAILFLSYEFAQHFYVLMTDFPFQLLACTFILYQIAEYILSFKGKRRIVFGTLSCMSVITITVLFLLSR